MDGEGEKTAEITDMTPEAVKANRVAAAEKKAVRFVSRMTEAGAQLSDETIGGMGKGIAKVRAQSAGEIKQQAVQEAAQLAQARSIVEQAQKGVKLTQTVMPEGPIQATPVLREIVAAKGPKPGKEGPLGARITNPLPAAKLR